MNQKTYQKIVKAAPFLVTARAIECREYLEPSYRLAIDILEVLRQSKWYKSCEIARYLMETNKIYQEKGLNSGTVCQILQALKKGSIALSSNQKQGWYFWND